MRVVAGSAKGRPLKSVAGMGTRPTTDKVKEAIFSMIGPYFEGGNVLDLFAGTGGLGIEALSRGMERAVFIDIESRSIDTIKANLKLTGFESNAEIYRNDAGRAIKVLEKRNYNFDLVFLDPPYRIKNGNILMIEMASRGLLRKGALLVLEYESSYSYSEHVSGFRHLRTAEYGETAVSIYEFEQYESKSEKPGEEE
ncbi:16S rRNA (guanine(966)-N(2))-methyltransferase RsmD [Paenibacillus faecalis]|uniref:16S rRNA (guanine(966)-N(2))-methyltransferase RsmD n=1 Tax=Paenibacillus faecalis TaxID=2079532 RepID=UPI000D1001B3|nr:16S rRNA (guanine(966)-N(2))-methyltransferase RsmD [Paenibacillus faecalis]